MEWYILRVYTGNESAVRREILFRFSTLGWDADFGDVLIPMERIIEKSSKGYFYRKLLTGYMFVKVTPKPEIFDLLAYLPGVFELTGFPPIPKPLQPEQVDWLYNINREYSEKYHGPAFHENQEVLISDSTFKGFEGTIISSSKKTAAVLLQIFGRAVTVQIPLQYLKAL